MQGAEELRFASMFLVDLALWCAVAYTVAAYLSSFDSCVPGANFKPLQIFIQFIFLILFFLLLISDTKIIFKISKNIYSVFISLKLNFQTSKIIQEDRQ